MPAITSPAEFLDSIRDLPDEAVINQRVLAIRELSAGTWRKLLTGTAANNVTDGVREFLNAAPRRGEPPVAPHTARSVAEEVSRQMAGFLKIVLEDSLRRLPRSESTPPAG